MQSDCTAKVSYSAKKLHHSKWVAHRKEIAYRNNICTAEKIALRTPSNAQENNEKTISFCTHGKSERNRKLK